MRSRSSALKNLLLLVLCVLPVGVFCQTASASTAQGNRSHDAAAADPASLVNVFIGTGNGGKVTGDVDTFPGAVVPFGMLSWSPTTPSRPEGGDYAYKDSAIQGFSLTHLSGPGCPSDGEVPILPTTGKIGPEPEKASEPFSHAHERASPGRYRVTLVPGKPSAIRVDLTTTTRTGIGEFRFPSTGDANVLFKVSDGQTTSPSSAVRIVNDHAVAGMETSGHFCGMASTATLYFVAEFDRPFETYGTWERHAMNAGSRGAAGSDTGAWVTFNARKHSTVKLKVAISYVSVADAWANLKAEDAGWNLGRVARRARADWNHLLSRITVHGGTRDQQVQFYSALYHSFLHPNVFSDVNGDYIGFDDKVHHLGHGQMLQYANFSGWDIYRSEIPLLALFVPHRVEDMVTSLLNDQSQGGWLPKWGYDNDYTGVMNGDAADPVIAEAYAFGARNFDTAKALKAMVKGATVTYQPSMWSGGYIERPHLNAYERLGYVPGNASETLEYATADFAIARYAKFLGKTKTYQKFLNRSGDWRNTFDKQARFRGYAGYSEPRSADGKFPAGPGFQTRHDSYGQRGFEEGNTIQYTWMVPQDLQGLARAMGGDKIATERLDKLFTHLNVGPNKPFYWAGNEPGLDMPWIYDYTGAPYKTQAIVHRLLSRVYSDTPGGEPGNDDLGAMSSWLVWSYLGMYPETPGAPVLVLGAPVFPRITLRLGNGHDVAISAPGASLSGYVHKLDIDGRAWPKDWLPASLLLGTQTSGNARRGQATELSFTLGSEPDTKWGAAANAEPPSYKP